MNETNWQYFFTFFPSPSVVHGHWGSSSPSFRGGKIFWLTVLYLILTSSTCAWYVLCHFTQLNPQISTLESQQSPECRTRSCPPFTLHCLCPTANIRVFLKRWNAFDRSELVCITKTREYFVYARFYCLFNTFKATFY